MPLEKNNSVHCTGQKIKKNRIAIEPENIFSRKIRLLLIFDVTERKNLRFRVARIFNLCRIRFTSMTRKTRKRLTRRSGSSVG